MYIGKPRTSNGFSTSSIACEVYNNNILKEKLTKKQLFYFFFFYFQDRGAVKSTV